MRSLSRCHRHRAPSNDAFRISHSFRANTLMGEFSGFSQSDEVAVKPHSSADNKVLKPWSTIHHNKAPLVPWRRENTRSSSRAPVVSSSNCEDEPLRSANEKKFTLRDVHLILGSGTPLSPKDFEDLADPFSDLSNERLLVFALPGLEKIAVSSDPQAREWLRSILDHAGNTPEKRALLDLLGSR